MEVHPVECLSDNYAYLLVDKATKQAMAVDPADAEDVIAKEQSNGGLLISARRNRLILEDRLPIPVTRRHRSKGPEDVQNRWIFASDQKDRDGFFIGRVLKPIELGRDYTLNLEPQFLVQRAYDGETNSYSAPGTPAESAKVNQPRSKLQRVMRYQADHKSSSGKATLLDPLNQKH